MLWSNIKRQRKYGAPDLDKSKEAGMQDKTEWENKASNRSLEVCLRILKLNSRHRISVTCFDEDRKL